MGQDQPNSIEPSQALRDLRMVVSDHWGENRIGWAAYDAISLAIERLEKALAAAGQGREVERRTYWAVRHECGCYMNGRTAHGQPRWNGNIAEAVMIGDRCFVEERADGHPVVQVEVIVRELEPRP